MNTDNQELTHFLNVDLDLFSKSNLEPLVNAVGKKVHILHIGRHKRTYRAHLEVDARTQIRRYAPFAR